jgi:NADH:ubiquinone oxidoreductase subunit C
MKSEEIKALIEENLPDVVVEVPRERRVMVYTPIQHLIETMHLLREKGVSQVSTITGVDKIQDNRFEILYHLYWEQNEITVRVEVDRREPIVPTMSTVMAGALTYEREIQDMFGIIVKDIPDERRLLLFDEWPEGKHPLRKDFEATEVKD